MASITQPLRDEHKELFPQVELLRKAGEAVKEGALNEELRRLADSAYDFLAHHLIPHAQAEERALYPVVQRVMGAPARDRHHEPRPSGSGRVDRAV